MAAYCACTARTHQPAFVVVARCRPCTSRRLAHTAAPHARARTHTVHSLFAMASGDGARLLRGMRLVLSEFSRLQVGGAHHCGATARALLLACAPHASQRMTMFVRTTACGCDCRLARWLRVGIMYSDCDAFPLAFASLLVCPLRNRHCHDDPARCMPCVHMLPCRWLKCKSAALRWLATCATCHPSCRTPFPPSPTRTPRSLPQRLP